MVDTANAVNVKRALLIDMKCDGFEFRTRQRFEKDGYIVKVLAKRKTVFGTAWYQLNHASVRVGVEHFRVATWFGICSYRKLKLMKSDRIKRDVCPICGSELVHLQYVGNGNPSAEFWAKEFFEFLLDEHGATKWIVASKCEEWGSDCEELHV